MKKQYIIPITELVVINLQDSLLDDAPVIDPSFVAGEVGSNKGMFEDLEDDPYDLPASKSLWE